MNNPTVKKYCKPSIEMVCLDNEISLQLASGIPTPGDAYSPQTIVPDFMLQDPFKSNNA
jgi:hypothetical protein